MESFLADLQTKDFRVEAEDAGNTAMIEVLCRKPKVHLIQPKAHGKTSTKLAWGLRPSQPNDLAPSVADLHYRLAHGATE